MVGKFETGTGQAKVVISVTVKAVVSFGPFRFRKTRTGRKIYQRISPSSQYQVFYEALYEEKGCLPQVPHFPHCDIETFIALAGCNMT